jgi:hypothetical protein
MGRRFDRHGRERWDEEDEEGARESLDLFEREAQFARSSGDPRWGTGGMPVEGGPPRSRPAGVAYEGRSRPRYEPVERPVPAYPEPAYPEWEGSRRGPYAGRGPRGYHRSDDRILEDVCEWFTEHSRLDPSDVEVTVRSGEVTLSGTVATRAEKRLAEDIADMVFGVVEVHNRLRVQRPGEAPRAVGATGGPPVVNGTLER